MKTNSNLKRHGYNSDEKYSETKETQEGLLNSPRSQTEDEDLSLDEALGRVGGYRPYSLITFFFLGFSSFIPLCWQGLGVVFVGKYSMNGSDIDIIWSYFDKTTCMLTFTVGTLNWMKVWKWVMAELILPQSKNRK